MSNFNIVESSEILKYIDTLKLTLVVPKQSYGQPAKKSMASYVKHQITYNPGNGPIQIGYITADNITTTDAMVDPSNLADGRNNSEFKDQIKYRIHSNLAKCGDFGKIMQVLYPQWQSEVARISESGEKPLGKRDLTCGYSTHFISVKDGIRTIGDAYDVPGIYFRIQPGQHPMNHPDRAARGCDRLEVFDLETSTESDLQRMVLDDGSLVTTDNLCKIINRPDITLDCAVIDLSSTAYTSMYASWSLNITKIYMRKPANVVTLPSGVTKLLLQNKLPAFPINQCEVCYQDTCNCGSV